MVYLRIILRNVRRHPAASLLTALICVAAALLLMFYSEGLALNVSQLETLSQSVPVTCQIVNQNGSRNVGLQINSSLVDDIKATGLVSNLKYTIQMQGSLDS